VKKPIETDARFMPIGLILVNVFVAGLSIMAIEMSAFRLLAPSFGTTQLMITNVIGTIMIALSLGYWLGGRLGDRHPTPQGIYWLVTGSAVLTAAIPLISKPILIWADTAVASQHFGSFLSSLSAMVFIFMIPLGMLGMVSPYAIRISAKSKETVGASAGKVYSLATIGSILGTYLPTLIFIPWVGTRASILIFSAVMLLSGSIGLLSVRRGRIMIAALWAAFGCLLYPGLGPVKGGTDTLAEFESLYNYIQVVKKNGTVLLYLNDGNGDHSVHDPGSELVGGYWDTFLALPAMSALTDEELNVLIIGLGGGTIANQLSYYWRKKLHIDGVEIDGKIIEAADRFFALDRRFLDVHVDDGRRFLSSADGLYQVIILDAYKQPYIPFHLTTVEFFKKCRDHLKRGGVVGINVATFRENPEFLQMIAETLGAVFPYVYVYEIPNNDGAFKNVVLVAASDPPRLKGLAQAFPNGPPDILWLVEKKIKPLVMRDKPRVMSDDWAPMEWQVDKTLFNF
jgi:spermidine synthase